MSKRTPDSISINLADGRMLDANQPKVTDDVIQVMVGAQVPARFFESCPICGDPATDDEHVPPESVGGKVMTRTCRPCNNRLGSHVEADLADW